jgi:hypothetical protein
MGIDRILELMDAPNIWGELEAFLTEDRMVVVEGEHLIRARITKCLPNKRFRIAPVVGEEFEIGIDDICHIQMGW